MDLSGIIAISGKPGLFKVIAQGKNNIIVESLIDGKRIPAYAADRISALEDISIYTYDEDQALQTVFISIYKKEEGKECPSHKENYDQLFNYLLEILPNFDQERVYPSDVKKIFQWYNLLHKSGKLILEEEKQVEKETETADKKDKTAKTDKPKKVAAKPKVDAPKAAKAAKPAAPKKTTAVKTGSSRGK
jgi:ATP-dependent helicase YprA (DUF1998 family)